MTPIEDDATQSRPSPAPAAAAPLRVLTDRELDRDIPYGVRIAASWSWRLGLILLMTGTLIWLLSHISFLIIPVMVAALLAGLLSPVTAWLKRRGLPAGLAVAVTVLGFIGVIAGALALVGRQLVIGFGELWQQALEGVQQVQTWLGRRAAAPDGGPDRPVRQGSQRRTAEQQQQHPQRRPVLWQHRRTLRRRIAPGPVHPHLLPARGRPDLGVPGPAAAAAGAGRHLSAPDARAGPPWSATHGSRCSLPFVDAVGIGVGAAIIGVPLALPLGVLVFIGLVHPGGRRPGDRRRSPCCWHWWPTAPSTR